MKKIQLLVVAILCMCTAQLFAGGISGYVTDSKNQGKSKVRVTVKYGDQTNYTYTRSNGSYVIEIPATYAGVKARVYVSGTYVTRCTIPKEGYNTVNAKLK
ncbi:MAG: hypothetical protein KJO79_05825 [Verrucomicrobiae bacterium]|nr:hypothetical protein [Verrucomicrobiae bacterium]NNJ86682.1 hypothetical protein [Akkermansiaceae bacterium]